MVYNRIHILQVLHTLEIGGAEKLAYDISKNFDPSFKFSFCCLDSLGYISKLIQDEGGEVFCLNRKEGIDFELSKNFAKLISDKKIDVIHAHQYTPYFYSAMAKMLSKNKPGIVFTEHGRHQPDKVRWKRVVFNKIFQFWTNYYTGVSKFSKDSLVKYEKIPESRIEVVYNGIDITRFPKYYNQNDIRDKLGFPKDKKIVAIIARLDPIKDHKTLIDAINTVKDKISNTLLYIVGDGPVKSDLVKQVNELNLDKFVKFLGTRTDVPEILMGIDLFVLPSIMEATSVTLLEAMGASKPSVATDVGGNREIVIPNITGKLVPVSNSGILADNIIDLLSDERKMKEYGTNARQRIEDNFTFDKMVENYRRIYLEIMPGKR